MRLLLDTHVILWWVEENPRLGRQQRDAILRSDTEVLFSIASMWEIAIKLKLGKLRADLEEIEQALDADRFRRLEISLDHLRTLTGIPAHHRDPFDHLLIAQAISENATLVSSDRVMRDYPIDIL